jgi:hypothetical protein
MDVTRGSVYGEMSAWAFEKDKPFKNGLSMVAQ